MKRFVTNRSVFNGHHARTTSDVVETVTSETETWLKFRDEAETLP